MKTAPLHPLGDANGFIVIPCLIAPEIKHPDRIIVVQNGAIIEQGAHDNLLHQDGAYKNLILAQTV
ncbi:hypothetical protein ACQKFG_25575 [Peribacillus sp. NPDC076916]|uniref:hypothetical protein n=1 Tax=Peribacillus sp. NPDC076916 TaxID=3390608 RepID=UPI003D04AD28